MIGTDPPTDANAGPNGPATTLDGRPSRPGPGRPTSVNHHANEYEAELKRLQNELHRKEMELQAVIDQYESALKRQRREYQGLLADGRTTSSRKGLLRRRLRRLFD
ncbi:OmpH family outer membrane protein [Haloarculaceae archaeon H-GB2-1]|nr:OmpH family outer membrane protein [Haloarculaceae archaeon H-GB1-1]MEA5387604.1 OmpH family outer membrane protein [Haloarculaceae archaeon H-GB11]MEA5409090.1 OmpH family outer membrane protein [Haloarculaceae archaeon H-GB2-1]